MCRPAPTRPRSAPLTAHPSTLSRSSAEPSASPCACLCRPAEPPDFYHSADVLLRARVTPVRVLAPLLGLLLLAFGLRVAGLETQSIWVDEGFSVDFSSRTATCMTDMWRARGGAGTVSDAQTP